MTLSEMKEQLRDLNNQLRSKVTGCVSSAMSVEEVTRVTAEANDIRTRMNALRDAIQLEESAKRPSAPITNNKREDKNMNSAVKTILASNEYARAFAGALRTGYKPGFSAYREDFKPLHDVLTEGTGNKGGFLVPDELQAGINKKVREIAPLAALFNNQTVSSDKGWMVVGNAASAGFSAFQSEGNRVPTISDNASQLFTKVAWNLGGYGLMIPVENELLADDISGLMAYLTDLLGDQMAITKNAQALTLLASASASSYTAGNTDTAIDVIKGALNVALDPAISRRATIVTNQDGYALLDSLKDSDGRPLLTYLPTDPSVAAIRGRRVVVVSNSQLASTTASGTTTAPIYVGDLASYGCLFDNGALQISSTDVGGGAFENYQTIVRAVARLDAQTADTAAAVKIGVTV